MEFEQHLDQPDVTDIKLVDGVFVKTMVFRYAEMHVPQHAHKHNHLSLIATGAVRVFAENRMLGEFIAPNSIVIKARVKHRFVTLLPNTTICCIHNADRAEHGEDVAIHAEHTLGDT